MNLNSTYIIKNNERVYDLRMCIKYINFHGKQKYGRLFKSYSLEDETVIFLLAYATRKKALAGQLGIDLDKGLLLIGSPECGKKTLMYLVKPFFSAKQQFVIRNCMEIASDYNRRGRKALESYLIKENDTIADIFCFNDFGKENIARYSGEECNVMNEILESHYIHFVEKGVITHVTTSLDFNEIEDKYGVDTKHKLEKMMNTITFPPLK